MRITKPVFTPEELAYLAGLTLAINNLRAACDARDEYPNHPPSAQRRWKQWIRLKKERSAFLRRHPRYLEYTRQPWEQ